MIYCCNMNKNNNRDLKKIKFNEKSNYNKHMPNSGTYVL